MPGDQEIRHIGELEVKRYERYLKKKKKSPLSVKNQCRGLTKFFISASDQGVTKVSDINWKHFKAFRDQLLDNGLTGNSVMYYMSSVLSYYKMRYNDNLTNVEFNRYNKMKAVSKPDNISRGIKHHKAIKIEDIDTMLDTAKGMRDITPYSCYNEAEIFLMTLLYSSARAEIYGLKVEEINYKDKRLCFIQKMGREHEVPLHPDLEAALKIHLKTRPYESDFVFKLGRERDTYTNRTHNSKTAWTIVKRVAKNSGLKKITTHMFRKTVGSYLNAKGVPLKIIQKLMGHTDFSMTTNLYTEVTTDMVADALKGISFLGNGEVPPEKIEAIQRIANMDPKKLQKLIDLVEVM